MKIITFKETNLKKKQTKTKTHKKTKKRHTKKKKRNPNNTERPTECLTAKRKKKQQQQRRKVKEGQAISLPPSAGDSYLLLNTNL